MSSPLPLRRQVKIGPDFSFWTSLDNVSLEKQACKYFEDNLSRFEKDASFLESDVIIVLDTNVLLYLYTLPARKRDGILKYISKNKNRVYFPGQVVVEYLKHRSNSINAAQKSLKNLVNELETIINELVISGRKTLSNKLDSFKQLVIIKNEMPSVVDKINAWSKSADESLEKVDLAKTDVLTELKEKVKEAEMASSSLTNDKVLETVCCAKHLEPLGIDEKEFLKNRYNLLLEQYNKEKDKIRYAFPGCGDRKKIVDGFDPCGDFYIYHEILALMKEMDCDAMFITNDVTKSDWVMQDRHPFMHYLFDEFAHTGHMINIVGLDAIPMDITPIIPDEKDPHEGELEEHLQDTETEVEPTVDKNPVVSEDTPVVNTRIITEDQFLEEFTICYGWATNYGGGYVNEEFFLRNILGSKKHYNYDQSKAILQKLLKKKVLKIEDQEHRGNMIKCVVWGEKHKEV